MSDANDYLNPIFAQTKLMQDGEANIEKKTKRSNRIPKDQLDDGWPESE
jgi:hypothetical protein